MQRTAATIALAVCVISAAATAQTSAPAARAADDRQAGAQRQVTPQERAAYKQEVQERIATWRDKIDRFGDKLSERSATAGGQANARVMNAWRRVSSEWQRFQAAAAADWARAQRELEQALRQLEQAWQAREPQPDQGDSRAGRDDDRPFFYAIDMATRMQA